MSKLKNAFDLYINSSIHVSLSVVALTLVSFFEYDIALDYPFLLFIFVASITGYNFVKYAGIAKLHHLSLARNLKLIQLFSLCAFIAMIYLIFALRIQVVIAAGILGAITGLYALPVFGKQKNLRSVTGLKIFVIAIVWAGVTVFLPLIQGDKYLVTNIMVDFFQRVLLVIILTLPFEIRDLEYDTESLGTIPQKLGVYKTKIFGSILVILLFLTELFQSSFKSSFFLALIISLMVATVFLWNSKSKQGKYYSSFWVEAIPILYLGLVFFMGNHS